MTDLEHLTRVAEELNKLRPVLHAEAVTETRERNKNWGDDDGEKEQFTVLLLKTDFGNITDWDIKAEHTNYSAWRSKPNGKSRFAVGYYGDRKSFPQRKDGTFNYPEIAQMMIHSMDRLHARQAKERMANSNRELTERIREKVGYGVFKWVNSSEYASNKVSVEVGTHHLTEEQAMKLFEMLKSFKA